MMFTFKNLIFCMFCLSLEGHAIVGGQEVEPQELEAQSTAYLSNGCTGTLIAKNWVLTAAHCLKRTQSLRVAFAISPVEVYNVEEVIPHSRYSGARLGGAHPSTPAQQPIYDIGLVKLATSVSSKLKPVALARKSILPLKGGEVILAGFGITNPSTGVGGGVLRKTTTQINYYNDIAKEIVFGPTPGKSACPGDSGGPMYIKSNQGELIVMGVTSRGFPSLGPCSGNGNYTSVVDFTNWIEFHMGRSSKSNRLNLLSNTDFDSDFDSCKEISASVSQECFERLRAEFLQLYPRVRFSFIWNENTPQAFARGRTVVLTGGFARKADINLGGFLTVLCHEVGHAAFRLSEGQADDFAARNCIPNYIKTHLADGNFQSNLAIDTFCGVQSEISQQACRVRMSIIENAANADRKRCLKNLKSIGSSQLQVWSRQKRVPEKHHRCFLAAKEFPTFGFSDLLSIHQRLLIEFEQPLKYFKQDERRVRQTYHNHNSPQCRMDTLINGTLGLAEPRCWAI